jgi:drug/metabolite transporter (DMT)-like permease
VILFKKGGETVAPLPLNLFKNLLVLLLLVPVCGLVEGSLWPDPTTGEVLLLVLSGGLGFTVADTLFLMALNRLGAGLNAVVDCFYAPSMLGMAYVFLGERLPLLGIVGAVLVVGAIGIAVEARPAPGRSRRDVVTGVIIGIVGMVVVAASVVTIKHVLVPDRILWIGVVRLVAGIVGLVPILLWAGEGPAFVRLLRPTRVWRYLVPAALLGTGLAPLVWLAGMEREDVSVNAALNQLSTIFIFVLAAIALREPVTRRRLAAVVLAFAGALLVVLR